MKIENHKDCRVASCEGIKKKNKKPSYFGKSRKVFFNYEFVIHYFRMVVFIHVLTRYILSSHKNLGQFFTGLNIFASHLISTRRPHILGKK